MSAQGGIGSASPPEAVAQACAGRQLGEIIETTLPARLTLAAGLSKLRALVAIARTILVIIWHVLASRTARLRDLGATYCASRADKDKKDADLVPLDELIRQTPGAHPIGSIGELRCDAFDTEEELEEFLAFVTESRHADLA